MAPQFLRFFALAAVTSLAACGGASAPSILSSAASPVIPASSGIGRVATKPLSARALTAYEDCSLLASIVDNGQCSHVQLSSISLDATAPLNLIPGLHPADLQSAYNLPSLTAGAHQTIGIVVGGDDPTVELDLSVYRTTFGLRPCTTLNGCFRKIHLTKIPPASASWAGETSIDLDMASAVCPNCNLLLVEAKSSGTADLANAVTAAIANGATVVSNSYVIPESSSLNDAAWDHPGVPIVAASGDQGYQSVANWPAASSHVIAVGGTTLVRSGSARGWSETAWSRSGSSCSTIALKPAWQTDTACSKRTVSDVAAVGDPATPVAVFDTYLNTGWVLMAGTSVAAPIVAGVYALAGNAASITGAASIYAHSSALFPVLSGSNGTCAWAYLCSAGVGYNGPGGLGSPNGIGAF